MDCRRRADRAAVCLSRCLSSAYPDPDPDLVVRLYVVVDDGPLRAGVARAWRDSWCVRPRDGAALGLHPRVGVAVHIPPCYLRGGTGARSWRLLSLLSP